MRAAVTIVALALFACVTQGKEVFRTESLGEGVTLYRPIDERSGRTNSLVVERKNDLSMPSVSDSLSPFREGRRVTR